MNFIAIVFAATALLEIILFTTPLLWKIRKIVSIVLLFATAFASGALVMWRPNTLSAFIALAGMYRIVNYIRIVYGRMHERYLRHATRRTSLILLAAQGVLFYGWWQWYQTPVSRKMLWLTIAVAQVVIASVFLASTIRRLRHTKPVIATDHVPQRELPSITIAIPARNETEDLRQCLQSIIANTYPKFEVIVLDDCSQNKKTPEIIRSFAHDGVRFIPGEEPKDTWLPKNQAYDRLVKESSGEYILFCGVDVRFKPDTIGRLVEMVRTKQKDMVSILPMHVNGAVQDTSLIQAMRYWWEMVPPRRLFNRPSVISSCWIIRREALKKTGGFAAVTRSIVPEAYFAKKLIAYDGYSFVRSNTLLGLESAKAPSDQRETAIRMRYPQLHRKPEQVFFSTVLEALFLLMPFVIAITGNWLPIKDVTHILAIAASLLLVVSYSLAAVTTRVNSWLFSLIAFPFVVIIDLILMQKSMWQYEFSEVIWKGRNVCIPTMHVVPHLPKLEDHPEH